MEAHVSFRGRKPVPQHVDIGMERENKVTVLCFEGLPEMEGSTAYLHIDLGDNSDVIEIVDGQADVKRTLTQFTGSAEAFVEVLGANDRVWHSQIMELFVGRLPILGEKIEQAYPTAFEQALAQTAADKAAAAKSAADAAATAAGIVTEETARKEAESKRVIAEKGRVKAEAQREEAMAQHAEKIAELESEVAKKAKIDDTTVSGTEAWSSQHIVDMLCPPLEASGNPVVCYPVAGSKLGVTASWEPTQEGSGEPYPAGGGKNLADNSLLQNKLGVSTDGRLETAPDGRVAINGDINVSGIDTVTLSCGGTATFIYALFDGDTLIKREASNPNKSTIDVSGGNILRVCVYSGVTIADIKYIQVEAGSTATAYAPYANIRPISGRTAVSVERCGENLLNIAPFTKLTESGVTYEYVANGGVRISGTAMANVDSPTFAVGHLPPGKYYGHDIGTGIAAFIVVQRNGANLRLNAKGIFEILAGDVIKYWYMIANNGVTHDKTVYPYIVPGTTAPATYTPYTGSTTMLTLPSTIYGGAVEANGEGEKGWKLLTLDGTENWNTWGVNANNSAVTGFFTYDINDYDAENVKGICSNLSHSTADTWGGRNSGIGFATVGSSRYFMYCLPTAILADTSDNSAAIASLKAFLAAQHAAGTPVRIAYKLATPVPFTATGGGTIKALSGTNTILTDADALTVKGRADPIHIIQQLQAASDASAQALADVERAVTDI